MIRHAKGADGWLDTNVIVRFLLNDSPDHSSRARQLVERAERGETSLHIRAYTLCETVYVLENQGFTRHEIVDALSRFLAIPGINVDNLPLVQLSLKRYQDLNVDFCDAPLYTECTNEDATVLTFNKRHFSRLGSGWREP
jgi:predicted nucleic-acid-binding protein